MKIFLISVMFIMAMAFSSCSNEEMAEMKQAYPQSRSGQEAMAQDSVLSFDSRQDFEAAVAHIASLPSEDEKAEWVRGVYPHFQSVQNRYWMAMEEMGEMENVDEECYNTFQKKYSMLYFPKYMDDAGFYIPMTDLDAAFLANENCEVIIGGEIVNLRDIEDYSKLMELGRAYYSIDNPMPIAAMTSFELKSTSMDPVGPEYDSGWTTYDDRKVKLKARRKFNTIEMSPGFNGSQSVLHLEFCFRKKTWLGWSNYKSESTLTFKATAFGGKPVTAPSFHHNSNSSHDSELLYPIRITSDASHWYYIFDEAPCEATVNFRGVSHILTYKWNMPGIQCIHPLSASHYPIVPYI